MKPSKYLLILLLICQCVFAKTLTIASYNVENLFDLNSDGTEYDVYVPGKWNLTSYKTKLQNASFVISKINADIISLQEIESQTAIDDLKTQLKRDGVNYPHKSFAKTAKQVVGVGVLSKYPIVNNLQYPVVNSRPILRCDIAVDEDTISVFSVHFPAKLHPESERIKAANVCKKAINLLGGKYEYYINGDFNSDFDEFAKTLSQELDNTKGKTGINHVLKTFRGNIGEKPQISFAPLNANEHFDPWIEIAQNERWSYIYRGNKNTLDHILFPQNMTDTIGWRYVWGSFSHFLIPEIIRDGKPYGWEYNLASGVHYNRGYSDHLPVIAKITNEKFAQRSKSENLIGLNGWITTHALAELKFVQNTPEGFAVYELSGKKIPSTATVAKIIAVADKNYKPLTMAVRGLGSFSLRSRIKTAENKNKWNYVSPVTKEITSQAKYQDFKSEKWTNAALLSEVSQGDTVEIEIRIQKETPFNIQFCAKKINGWYRLKPDLWTCILMSSPQTNTTEIKH
jgi:endonuclease/exonuclease/phosphatase family metal-dependent hydrolase